MHFGVSGLLLLLLLSLVGGVVLLVLVLVSCALGFCRIAAPLACFPLPTACKQWACASVCPWVPVRVHAMSGFTPIRALCPYTLTPHKSCTLNYTLTPHRPIP